MKSQNLTYGMLTKTEKALLIDKAIRRIRLYKKMVINDSPTIEIEKSFFCSSCLNQVLDWINNPHGCIVEF